VVVTTFGAVGGGGGTAAGDGLGVAALGAGGVLASVCRPNMMKCTVWAGGVFLGASGGGVSEPVAVGALGVAVSLSRFLDLEPLGEEEDSWQEAWNVVVVDGDDHRSGLVGEPSSSALVKVPCRANHNRVRVEDGVLEEGEQLFVVVREDVGRDCVNFQLYSGWRLGKRKPEIVSDGAGLVEAAGESIKIPGLRFSWSVGVSACQGDSASVVNLCVDAFWEEAVGFGEGGGSYVREGGSYALSKGVGSGSGSGGEEWS